MNDSPPNTRKQISVFWSAAPFVLMIGVLAIGSAVYHLNVAVLLLVSAIVTGIIAWAHGYSWQEMEAGIVEKLSISMKRH
jgi:Na+:H+ antiporter, NhaC family